METKNEVVVLTDTAKDYLKQLLKTESNSPDGVRISLASGGCSGLSYELNFDKSKENDLITEYDGIKVLVDPKSALYIYGLRLDYQGGLNGKGFIFDNPNAEKSCGCGTSFSVGTEVNIDYANLKKAKGLCPSEKPE